MSISELITPFHLERQALIYIRQSSPHQVLTNQEAATALGISSATADNDWAYAKSWLKLQLSRDSAKAS